MNSEKSPMRYDLQIIASWISPGAKVLDLGCGEGDLLVYLIEQKQVRGSGIERDEIKVAHCIEKGLSVLQGDINEEVHDYAAGSFDYVILSQTLQQVYEPDRLIRAMLDIGKKGIVSFPNFSHWEIRRQLLTTGYAPVSRQLPYQWYDTPNIRVITLKDFRRFIREVNLRILKEVAINTHTQDRKGKIIKFLPNLRATYGLYLIGNGR
jgi:methionine biosynthesis protein MetW